MKIIKEPVPNTAFQTSEKVFMIDVFSITNQEVVRLTFEEKNSTWKQGVWLGCDEGVEINGQHMTSATLWYETAPNQNFIKCFTLNGLLMVYNVWDKGIGRASQSHSSGMLIEDIPLGRRYKCNDIGFETGFDKLLFRIEHLQT
jgi:hypothetical protein